MQTLGELWELFEPVVKAEGLELYDIERAGPSGKGRSGGVIRIYLWNGTVQNGTSSGDKAQGVKLDDCARISRKISALDRFEEIIPERTTLEVSSPGVNRKLRTKEHFASAVGEHVSVKAYFEQESKDRTVKGTVLRFENETVFLELDDKSNVEIDFKDIVKSRVDFIFE